MNAIKTLAKRIAPNVLLDMYRDWSTRRGFKQYDGLSNEQIFARIYKDKIWQDSTDEFDSGPGTSDSYIASRYVAVVCDVVSKLGITNPTFVDLGCGDFKIGRKLTPLCGEYIGVDVVEALVDRNTKMFSSNNIVFLHRDIVNDELPAGDICFLREVMQHMSNQQILSVVKKLSVYKYVLITDNRYAAKSVKINADIATGHATRAELKSGVFLDKDPFNVSSSRLTELLRIQRGDGRTCMVVLLYKP